MSRCEESDSYNRETQQRAEPVDEEVDEVLSPLNVPGGDLRAARVRARVRGEQAS
jgi:hypothetical protein